MKLFAVVVTNQRDVRSFAVRAEDVRFFDELRVFRLREVAADVEQISDSDNAEGQA